jgi:hypothetical protein
MYLERNVMISMFFTWPPQLQMDCSSGSHNQPKQTSHISRSPYPSSEKDFIRDFILIAEDKSKKRLFSSGWGWYGVY